MLGDLAGKRPEKLGPPRSFVLGFIDPGKHLLSIIKVNRTWNVVCAIVRHVLNLQASVGLSNAARREPAQFSTPTIAPIRQVASVPDTMDRSPSETMSSRRSGAIVAMPPIMMPSEPKLAKPHIA